MFGLALILVLGCSRERRNPLDPETSLVVERLSPPVTVVATAGKGLVHLQWTGVSSRLLAGYALFRAERITGDFAWVPGDGDAALGITTSKASFVDSAGLSPRTYFYRLAAVDTSGGLSRYSPAVAVTVLEDHTPPAAPQNLTVVADQHTTGRLLLRWTPPGLDADGGELSGLAGFVVLRSEGNGASLAPVDTVDAQAQEYGDAGLKGATQYVYALQAFDPGGNYGPLSLPATAATQGVLPAANLSASGGVELVELTWNRSLDEALAGYNVYRSERSDGAYLRLEGNEGTPFTTGRTSYVDSNLAGGKTFYYRVSAVRAADESALSAFAGATTLLDTLSDSDVPRQLRLSATTPADAAQPPTVFIAWEAPDTEVARYEVQRTQVPDSSRDEDYLELLPHTADTSRQDQTVERGEVYYYRVRARDAAGRLSAWTLPHSIFVSP